MNLLRSASVLLGCQLVGEALHRATHVPLPGPVIGMMVLAGWFILRRREPSADLQRTSDSLLGWLGLLFVPAGVGIVANLGLLRAEWLPILVGLVGSSLMTLAATAWVTQRLGRQL